MSTQGLDIGLENNRRINCGLPVAATIADTKIATRNCIFCCSWASVSFFVGWWFVFEWCSVVASCLNMIGPLELFTSGRSRNVKLSRHREISHRANPYLFSWQLTLWNFRELKVLTKICIWCVPRVRVFNVVINVIKRAMITHLHDEKLIWMKEFTFLKCVNLK